MTDDVDFSISQFGDAWRLLCGASSGYVADGNGAVEYIFSGLPIPFFNVALLTARPVSAAALQGEGETACGWAVPRSVPWMFIVTHEALAPGVDAASVLDSCDLVPMLPMTGMRAQRVEPATRFPDGLLLDVPVDQDSCAALFDVNAAAYGVSLDACKPTYGKAAFWNGHVPALGRVDGRPVASAAVFMVDGYRYVALVATIWTSSAADMPRRSCDMPSTSLRPHTVRSRPSCTPRTPAARSTRGWATSPLPPIPHLSRSVFSRGTRPYEP
jgi:hypothetical protein